MTGDSQSRDPRTTDEDYYDDDPRDWDDEDGDDIVCGLMADGQCGKAGSEECDWVCPHSSSEHFAGSAAWRWKHGETDG